MIRRRGGLLVLLTATAAVLGCAGCEHGIILRGKVNIPLEVQRQFSKDGPGIVVIGGGSPGASVYQELLYVLCDPGSDVLSVPFYQDHYGCAKEGTMSFWVTRLAPVDRASLACGTGGQQNFAYLVGNGKITVPDSFDTGKTVASAKVTIFKGKGGMCRDGEETVEATVTLTP